MTFLKLRVLMKLGIENGMLLTYYS